MTSLWDRFLWFVFGCFFGGVLGYIVAYLRYIKEHVTHVEHAVDPDEDPSKWEQKGPYQSPKKDERGRIKWTSVALFLVVAMVVWSTFETSVYNNKLKTALRCVTAYNTAQGKSLRTRDGANKTAIASEIRLWTQYQVLYDEAKKNPKKIPVVQKRLNRDIATHRGYLIRAQHKRIQHPYPNPDVIKACKEKRE